MLLLELFEAAVSCMPAGPLGAIFLAMMYAELVNLLVIDSHVLDSHEHDKVV